MKNNWYFVAICIIVYLITSISTFFYVQSEDPSRFWMDDSSSYVNTGLAIIHTGQYAVSPKTPGIPQTIRTPGYPSFISVIYLLFGINPSYVIIIQIFISAFTVWITYIIARRFWSSNIATLATCLLALDITIFTLAQKLLTETIFIFTLSFIILTGINLITNPKDKKKWAILLGISLSIATLIRPINYYIVFPILIGFLIFGKSKGWKWKDNFTILILIATPSIVIIGGWQVRNLLITGSAEYSQIRGINLLYYRAADVIALRDGISFEKASQQILDDFPRDEEIIHTKVRERYAQAGLNIIKKHPLLFLKSVLRGLAKMMLVPGENFLLEHLDLSVAPKGGCVGDIFRLSRSAYFKQWLQEYPFQFSVCMLVILHLILLYFGTFLGIRIIIRSERRQFTVHIFIWGVILYFLLISSGPEAYARFRAPIVPFLALYSAKGISSLYEKWQVARIHITQ